MRPVELQRRDMEDFLSASSLFGGPRPGALVPARLAELGNRHDDSGAVDLMLRPDVADVSLLGVASSDQLVGAGRDAALVGLDAPERIPHA